MTEFDPTGTVAIIIYVVSAIIILVAAGFTVHCCRKSKSKSSNSSEISIVQGRNTKQSDRVILETGHNAIVDDCWNPKVTCTVLSNLIQLYVWYQLDTIYLWEFEIRIVTQFINNWLYTNVSSRCQKGNNFGNGIRPKIRIF